MSEHIVELFAVRFELLEEQVGPVDKVIVQWRAVGGGGGFLLRPDASREPHGFLVKTREARRQVRHCEGGAHEHIEQRERVFGAGETARRALVAEQLHHQSAELLQKARE